MDVNEATDNEFFFDTRLEGQPDRQNRSTVWHKFKKQLHAANWEAIRTARIQLKMHSDFNRHQQFYMSGPTGFSR